MGAMAPRRSAFIAEPVGFTDQTTVAQCHLSRPNRCPRVRPAARRRLWTGSLPTGSVFADSVDKSPRSFRSAFRPITDDLSPTTSIVQPTRRLFPKRFGRLPDWISLLDVPRHVHNHDTIHAFKQKDGPKDPCPLIMQKAVVPMRFD